MLRSPPKCKSCHRLMKIWQKNPWLDWTRCLRKWYDFQFYGRRHLWFYFGYCLYGYWWGIRAWLPLHIHTDSILKKAVSCCVNETLRPTPVKKMRFSIPKTDNVNVALNKCIAVLIHMISCECRFVKTGERACNCLSKWNAEIRQLWNGKRKFHALN